MHAYVRMYAHVRMHAHELFCPVGTIHRPAQAQMHGEGHAAQYDAVSHSVTASWVASFIHVAVSACIEVLLCTGHVL